MTFKPVIKFTTKLRGITMVSSHFGPLYNDHFAIQINTYTVFKFTSIVLPFKQLRSLFSAVLL